MSSSRHIKMRGLSQAIFWRGVLASVLFFTLPQILFAQENVGEREIQLSELLSSGDLYKEINFHLDRAEKSPFANEYEAAESQLSSLEELSAGKNPKNEARIHLELGYLYYFQRAYESSLHHFQLAGKEANCQKDEETYFHSLIGIATTKNNQSSSLDALAPLREAYQLSKKLGSEEHRIEALNQLATIYMAVGKLDSAHLYFDELLVLRRETEEAEVLVSELHHVGDLCLKQGAYDLAQAYLFEALEMASDLKNKLLRAALITDIADLFVQQKDWGKAIRYAEEGIELSESMNLSHLTSQNYKYKGSALEAQQDRPNALKAYRSALDLHINKLSDPTEENMLKIRIGKLLEAEADYTSAKKLLEEALQEKLQWQDKIGMLELSLNLGDLYLMESQYRKALSHLSRAEELSRELKSRNGMAKTYDLKSQTYSKLGNYKAAFEFHTLFKQVDDSLFTAEKTEIVQGLEEKYRAAQKEQRNLELQNEVTQNELLIQENEKDLLEKNAQIYFLIGSVGLLILLFIVFRYGNQKRRQLLQAKLETSEKEREAESLRSMISGEELERKRLARELHDGLGSHLASVKMLVAAIQNDIPEVKESELHQKAERMLDEACQEIREISHNLMPGTISRYGLEQSIQDMCINLQQSTKLQISCMLHIDRQIDESTQVSMYRIVQELLRNTVKHAQAKELIVQVQTDPDQISLTVEDDGIGYQDSNNKSDGIGLMNVRSRVELLKGSLDIDSRPGKGTSIYICIPLLPEAE
ncbi:MAG: tetratricopeptide repeat protein [Bacteroidia bacterium]|nr:tetratricopeptide repeat protein [Bacteroidia bacterium]